MALWPQSIGFAMDAGCADVPSRHSAHPRRLARRERHHRAGGDHHRLPSEARANALSRLRHAVDPSPRPL